MKVLSCIEIRGFHELRRDSQERGKDNRRQVKRAATKRNNMSINVQKTRSSDIHMWTQAAASIESDLLMYLWSLIEL